MSKNLPWFRLYSRTIDDPKLKLLAFEDRWHFIALLCLKCQGLIDKEVLYRDSLIAVQLGLTKTELDMLKDRLWKVGLIDQDFQPVSWDDLQYRSDSSKDRTKKYREKQSISHKTRHSDGDVTCQDTDTDTDTDKNKTSTSSQQAVNDSPARTPYQEIKDLYHQVLPNHPKVKVLTPARRSAIKQRHIHDMEADMENWASYFRLVGRSKFLTGKSQPNGGRRVFIADLEWICKQGNFAKIIEGKYHGE
jgi:hypothetical protein